MVAIKKLTEIMTIYNDYFYRVAIEKLTYNDWHDYCYRLLLSTIIEIMVIYNACFPGFHWDTDKDDNYKITILKVC